MTTARPIVITGSASGMGRATSVPCDEAGGREMGARPLPAGTPRCVFVGSVLLFDAGTEAVVRPDDWPAARNARG
jgi:hypothetical protein